MGKNSTDSLKKNNWPLYFSAIFVTLLILGYFFVPAIKSFFIEAWNVLTSGNQVRVKQWVDQFGAWGPIILIMAMIAQMFLIIIPTIMLMVVAILAYGPVWGTLVVFAAVFSASTVGYTIGKFFGHGNVERLIGQKTEKKVTSFLENYGLWAIIITRLNPFLSNDAISFVAGILRMGYWKFIGATLIGIAPLTVFIAILGESSDSLKTGLLWGSLVSLLIFLGYVWWDKRREK